MPRLFGTDGVRGLANADLHPLLAMSLALAAAEVLGGGDTSGASARRQVAVVGRDTRVSGEMLEAAVVAGLTSAGTDVLLVGVLPTPAVAHLTAELGADLGVMVSASHNPMPDNGIKFFGRGGHKLADAVEDEIERRLREEWDRPTGAGVGRVRALDGAAERYAEHLLATTTGSLAGLRLVVDAAHGAASVVGPDVYRKAGAEVRCLGCEPDGLNINDGVGATHLEGLRAAVVETGADLGLALDGDADRCLAVDASGEIVDGDQLLAISALALREQGALRGDAVVSTVMANLGFSRAMERAGIGVVRTAVGDRYVLEAMREHDLALGGEQSGHLVFADRATTGDGLLTGLTVLARMASTRSPLAELASVMSRLPQVLVNVPAPRARAVDPAVLAAVAAVEDRLGADGRVLLRPSGTEALVRVMVEASTAVEAQEAADAIAAVVAAHP